MDPEYFDRIERYLDATKLADDSNGEAMEDWVESNPHLAAKWILLLLQDREWIPVDERLPEDGQIVLICAGNPRFPHQTDAEFHGGKFLVWHTYAEAYDDPALNVTHWMPMPKAPAPSAERSR